jgi:hypothetical protein
VSEGRDGKSVLPAVGGQGLLGCDVLGNVFGPLFGREAALHVGSPGGGWRSFYTSGVDPARTRIRGRSDALKCLLNNSHISINLVVF